MPVADTIAPLVTATLGDRVLIRLTCWDGSTIGPASAPLHLVVRNRRALRRTVWAPNELGFARAYVSGDLDVEGDLVAGLEELDRVADPQRGPGVTIDTATKKAIVKAALRLRLIGLPPSPPPERRSCAGVGTTGAATSRRSHTTTTSATSSTGSSSAIR